MEQQLTKLKDANGKYKNLLKMAKERIQDQDDELELLKCKLLHMYSHFRLTFCLHMGAKSHFGFGIISHYIISISIYLYIYLDFNLIFV